MKHLLVFCLLICACAAKAQDLVVTQDGDSLNGKIIRSTQQSLYFDYKEDGVVKNVVFPVSEIKTVKYNYYAGSTGSVYTVEKSGNGRKKFIYDSNARKFKIGVDYNFAKLIYKSDPNQNEVARDYEKKFKTGSAFTANVMFTISESSSIGLYLSRFKTSEELNNVLIGFPDGSTARGKVSDDVRQTFVGATYASSFRYSKKCHLYLHAGIGYLDYLNEFTYIADFTLEGGTVALLLDLELELFAGEGFAYYFHCSVMRGSLKEVDLTDPSNRTQVIKFDKENRLPVSTLNLGIGINIFK